MSKVAVRDSGFESVGGVDGMAEKVQFQLRND